MPKSFGSEGEPRFSHHVPPRDRDRATEVERKKSLRPFYTQAGAHHAAAACPSEPLALHCSTPFPPRLSPHTLTAPREAQVTQQTLGTPARYPLVTLLLCL
ncbi:hypothetical protein CSUI_006338, partial [Cystoisospora suis]